MPDFPDNPQINPRALTGDALKNRYSNHYGRHPVENALHRLSELTADPGEKSDGGIGFQSAESIYRAGAQGIPVSQVPKLPRSRIELSRLRPLDRAGRRSLRAWAETHHAIFDSERFLSSWETQGCLGGAEHHVFYDETSGRWFKRLYHGVNDKLAR